MLTAILLNKIEYFSILGIAFVCMGFNTNLLTQETTNFRELNNEIRSLLVEKDTTRLAEIFSSDIYLSEGQEMSNAFMNFQFERARFLSSYSKVSADSVLKLYKGIYHDALKVDDFENAAKSLEKIATTYRSMQQLDKAFEYNQLELQMAHKSGNVLRVGSALITELDIVYNSLPWPIQKEDLGNLVHKSSFVIDYAETHNLDFILVFGKLYLSKFYIKQEEFEKAKTLLLGISDNEPLNVVFSKYEHLCEISKVREDLIDYRIHTLAFKKLAYKTKRPFVALNAHNYLLDYHLKKSNNDSSRFYVSMLEQNLSEVDTTKYLDFLDVSYVALARYYSKVDAKKELKYVSSSAAVNKIIAERQKRAFTAIMRYKNEVDNLEKENTTLLSSKAWFKSNFWLVIIFSALLIIGLFLLFKKYIASRSRVEEVIVEKEQLTEKVVRKSIELHNKQRIYLEDLKYIKADRNYVEFYTLDKRYVDRNILSLVISQLPPNFVQVHRSFAINKNFIKSTTGNHLILTPDIEIPISRTFKNRLPTPL